MRFDWQAFCRQHRIPFETGGKNTVKGNITIHCPWCGAADQSGHLGLSLDVHNPVWGCLRNAKHRGRIPARLVAKLLNISIAHARVMLEANGPPLDDFERAIDTLRDPQPEARRRPIKVELPSQFRRLTEGLYAEHYLNYLVARGFGVEGSRHVARDYELYYALTGPFAWRIIFPIRSADGTLLGWTGRDIRQAARIRYMTSEDLPADAVCTFRPQVTAPVLAICEGPFDALKLDVFGALVGVQAVASMGTALSPSKLNTLSALARQAQRTCMVFDRDAVAAGLDAAEELNARWVSLPNGVDDPGEMSGWQARKFTRALAL